MNRLKCQLLLRPEHRDSEGIALAAAAAASLGLAVTSLGAATISIEVEIERFVELFGVIPRFVEGKPLGSADYGSPPGFSIDNDIDVPVPEQLSAFVSSVSVAAPYTRTS